MNILVVPAKAGTQGSALYKFINKVAPLRITAFDQFEFPSTTPLLDLLLTMDCVRHNS